MTTGATGQLGLALPVQGELSGTWGDTVNNGLTQYINIAIAGTLTLTNDGAVTLANTTGDASASNITSTLTGAGTVTAQFAIVRVTGTLTTAKVVTAPSYSKTYTVVNAATGGIVTFKASGQTGVSIAVGETAFVYFNGTDYVKVAGTAAVSSFSAGTTGLTPNTATTGAVTLAGTLATTNGGTGLTSFTANGVVYASNSSTLATGSGITWDTQTFGILSTNATPLDISSSNASATVVLHKNANASADLFYRFRQNNGAGNFYDLTMLGASNAFTIDYNDSERLRIDSSGNVGIGTSSPSAPLAVIKSFSNDNLVYFGNTNTTAGTSFGLKIAAGTNSSDYALGVDNAAATVSLLRVMGSGNMGLGVTPSAWDTYKVLQVGALGSVAFDGGSSMEMFCNVYYGTGSYRYISSSATAKPTRYTQGNGFHYWWNAAAGTAGNAITFTQAMTLDASGNLLVGGTSQSGTANRTAVFSANKFGLSIIDTTAQAAGVGGALNLGGNYRASGDAQAFCRVAAAKENSTDANFAYAMTFATTPDGGTFTERARIDSLGSVIVGSTSPMAAAASTRGQVSVNGSTDSVLAFGVANNYTAYAYTSASILNIGTVTNIPFSFTTNSVERARITSAGTLLVAKTTDDIAVVGFQTLQSGQTDVTVSGSECMNINRNTNDGDLVRFRQDNNVEGSISVSGSTVSYNGGHLSRWAQTTTAKDDSIVKGTVLSNLDAMNVYTDAQGNPVDNEQLNKVKVSDTEGDVNVAGVFVNWTHDNAHNVDEINMAMTGDMIIRIAQGVTVVRGDLLMSAGDGTAKPQGDDIVRSKTVAKVISNHITCTYADGSYCVPCVLMAC